MVPNLCPIPDCNEAQESWNLCAEHLRLAVEHGTKKLMLMRPLRERFWEKVDKSGDCWTWTGSMKSNGYGNIGVHGKALYAHRVSYELHVGPIPRGLLIDHLCHNRACIRPEHLRAVTMKQNQEHRSGARSDSKSGVRGVHWSASNKKWRVSVHHNGTPVLGGYFTDLDEAGEAARALRNRLFTHNNADRDAA